MKKFYTLFPIANALRSQLTWTHYRSLLKVSNESARNWYIEEAIKGQWSSRQLERQINTLYYERLLGSQGKDGVIAEANANMSTDTKSVTVFFLLFKIVVEILEGDFLSFSYCTMNSININIDTFIHCFGSVGYEHLTMNLLCFIDTEDEEIEYWCARELMSLLGYDRWENFCKVIERAMDSCKSSNIEISDHFRDVTKMVTLGSSAKRKVKDFLLTRYACYLIAQNGDPRKEEIAFAQDFIYEVAHL